MSHPTQTRDTASSNRRWHRLSWTLSLLFALAIAGMPNQSLASCALLSGAYWQETQEVPPPAGQDKSAEKSAEKTEASPPANSDSQPEKTTEQEPDETLDDVNLNSLATFAKKLYSSRKYSRLAPEIVQVFAPSSASVSSSTTRIFHKQKQIAVGMIVDASGLIITKASELKSPLECQLPNGRRYPAKVVGIDQDTDLAMLKVESSDPLTPAHLVPNEPPPIGRWLASVALDPDPIALGIVSVATRQVKASQGRMGIQLEQATSGAGARINKITSGSPAEKADMFINDVIIKMNETEILVPADVFAFMADKEPGDQITIVVTRAGKEITFRLTLADESSMDVQGPENPQERMGISDLSKRRQNFPLAFQHDSPVSAAQCGSPLVDLDGNIVGINIARAGRVSTLALPMTAILPAIERLKSGELAPEIVNAPRLAEIELQLAECQTELAAIPEILATAETIRSRTSIQREELERMMAELQKRLDEVNELDKQETEKLNSAQSKKRDLERKQERLQQEKEQLSHGLR